MAGPMGGPKPGGAKAKDFKGSLLRLGKYLKPYRVGLVIVFVAAIMSVVFSIVSPNRNDYSNGCLFIPPNNASLG